MKLSDKHRKYIWIGVAVLAAIHFGPKYLTLITRQIQSSAHAEVHAKPSPAIPMPVAAPVTVPSAAAQLASTAGKYSGGGLIKTRQCKMELELDPPDPQGGYTAYMTITCFSPGFIVGMTPAERASGAMNLANQFTPASAALSGSVVVVAIKLKATKSIETLADGCPLAGASITPFGFGRIALDWEETGCPGGQLILQRQ